MSYANAYHAGFIIDWETSFYVTAEIYDDVVHVKFREVYDDLAGLTVW